MKFQIQTIWSARSIPLRSTLRFSALHTRHSGRLRSSFEQIQSLCETFRDPLSTALAREPRKLSHLPVALEVLSSLRYERRITTKSRSRRLIFSQSLHANLTRQFSWPPQLPSIHSQTSHEKNPTQLEPLLAASSRFLLHLLSLLQQWKNPSLPPSLNELLPARTQAQQLAHWQTLPFYSLRSFDPS